MPDRSNERVKFFFRFGKRVSSLPGFETNFPVPAASYSLQKEVKMKRRSHALEHAVGFAVHGAAGSLRDGRQFQVFEARTSAGNEGDRRQSLRGGRSMDLQEIDVTGGPQISGTVELLGRSLTSTGCLELFKTKLKLNWTDLKLSRTNLKPSWINLKGCDPI